VTLLRKILFWTHLAIGLAAGLVIALLAITGASIAYEPQIMAALERDVRVVTPPAPDAARLPLDTLIENLRARQPDARPQSITVSADPAAAVAISLGRDQTYYANPYTGEIRPPSERSVRVHDFFHLMENWHRALGRTGEQRDTGRAITGAANLLFLGLALSGLWLWWPRRWSWRSLRPSVWFTRGARGKARDWNWHNVIGLWASPVILVTTLTGAIMSYQWANNLLFHAAGSTPPPAREARPAATSPAWVTATTTETRPLGFDALLYAARTQAPSDWSTLMIRTATPQRRAAQPAPAASAPPVTITLRAASLTAPRQLTLNPFTGETLTDSHAPATPPPDLGRRLRALVKPLHTGTLGGWPHQTLMLLSALGTLVLVYTGFALAFRRFFKRKSPPQPAG
jgi:uncharacterized iron-regulated membrane protein